MQFPNTGDFSGDSVGGGPKVAQENNTPILSREEWDCLAEGETWISYKHALTNLISMSMIQKKLIEDASRYSRSNRIQMLKQKDQRASRAVIKDPSSTNSMMQELITQNKEEERRLSAENRTLTTSIELSIGGRSTDRREGWIHQRFPLMRPRESYSETTSAEGLNTGEMSKRKGMKRDAKSGEEKRREEQMRRRQMGFDRERIRLAKES